MPTSPQAIAAKLNKKMGENIITVGSQVKTIDRLPTGSIGLDIALGGGWPKGHWSEVIGYETSGKTVLALHTIAENQRRDSNFTVLWVAAEEYVADWAAKNGVDNSRIFLVESNIMEVCYQAVIEYAGSGTVDLIVIDSYPEMVALGESDRAMDEDTIALGARTTGQFFRKVNAAMRRSGEEEESARLVTGLFINQWRDQVGVTHGDPRITPGGKAKNYAFFSRVEVRRTEWLTANKVVVGQRMVTKAVKNKLSPGRREAAFNFYNDGEMAGQIDHFTEIFDVGCDLDVFSLAGSWYTFNGERYQGKEKLKVALDADPELRRLAEGAVLTAAGLELPEHLRMATPDPPAKPAPTSPAKRRRVPAKRRRP